MLLLIYDTGYQLFTIAIGLFFLPELRMLCLCYIRKVMRIDLPFQLWMVERNCQNCFGEDYFRKSCNICFAGIFPVADKYSVACLRAEVPCMLWEYNWYAVWLVILPRWLVCYFATLLQETIPLWSTSISCFNFCPIKKVADKMSAW